MGTKIGKISKNTLCIFFSFLTDGWTEKFIFLRMGLIQWIYALLATYIFRRTKSCIYFKYYRIEKNLQFDDDCCEYQVFNGVWCLKNPSKIIANICKHRIFTLVCYQSLSWLFACARVCISVFFQMKCIFKWSVVFKCRIPMSVIIKIDTVTHSI